MCLEILEKGDLAIFQEPLSCYRRHKGQEGQQADVVILSRIEWGILNKEYFERQVYPYRKEDYEGTLLRLIDEFQNVLCIWKDRTSPEVWARYEEFIKQSAAKVGRL